MKKLLPLFIFAPLFLAFMAYFWWAGNIKSPNPGSQEVKDFLIVKGASASQIGENLEKEGLIKNALAFKIYVQFTNRQNKVQAGEYRLSSGKDLMSIVDDLTKGPAEVWVTIPEGLRREEIAVRFVDGLGLSGTEGDIFFNEFMEASSQKQGTLFPDTYLFPKTVKASVVVNKMVSTYQKRIEGQLKKDMESSPLGVQNLLVLASLVERETRGEAERPVVAGIILKRLETEWPLQIDATVQYGVASKKCSVDKTLSLQGASACQWWPVVTKADIDSDTFALYSHNTYKLQGLPPTPIANPGLSAIKAAVYPEDSDYWYYLHDSKGVIHYARTLEEHNANINNYL